MLSGWCRKDVETTNEVCLKVTGCPCLLDSAITCQPGDSFQQRRDTTDLPAGAFLGLLQGTLHVNKEEILNWSKEFAKSQQVAVERAKVGT